MKAGNSDRPGLALKIGIAGAIGLGAVVSGLLVSRSGRKLVREAWQGRRRSRLEDRVLDALWNDPIVGKCDFDVAETSDGQIVLSGIVRSRRERARALRVTGAVKEVTHVENALTLERPPRRRRRDTAASSNGSVSPP
jgi:hypothetical protein